MAGLEVHGERGAQIVKAGVHFSSDGPAVGAHRARFGKQPGLGVDFSQVLGDGERIPDDDVPVRETRDEYRRGQQEKLAPCIAVVERNLLFLEIEAGHFAQ